MPGLSKDVLETFIETFFEFSSNQEYMSFDSEINKKFLLDVSNYCADEQKVTINLSRVSYSDFEKMAICCRSFYHRNNLSVVRSYLISWFDQKIFIFIFVL